MSPRDFFVLSTIAISHIAEPGAKHHAAPESDLNRGSVGWVLEVHLTIEYVARQAGEAESDGSRQSSPDADHDQHAALVLGEGIEVFHETHIFFIVCAHVVSPASASAIRIMIYFMKGPPTLAQKVASVKVIIATRLL